MRYLRRLSNSLVAGLLATCYVLTLVLRLNPTLPLNPIHLAPLMSTVGLFYAVHAPDGFLLAYGGPVARGRRAARASLVDVVPTILYFLGLPVGRDMDGYARTDWVSVVVHLRPARLRVQPSAG